MYDVREDRNHFLSCLYMCGAIIVLILLWNFFFNLFSNALEIELGGGRQISEFSTVRMMYTVGLKVNYSLKLSEPS